MQEIELLNLLESLKNGAINENEILEKLKQSPFRADDLSFAEPDLHRRRRHGLSEVIYGESKTSAQILQIAERLSALNNAVLITRLSAEKIQDLQTKFPTGRANSEARTFIVNPPEIKENKQDEPFIAILAAGTSDLNVADEAAEVCVAMNTAFVKFYDVGVAGLHRLLDKRQTIEKATALVVVAGMEGALPSVVGGLFGKPLFAVPTSVGYGASFGGVTALLAMLNSCAPGVAVVNIDNGFSAGFAACQVIRAVRNSLESQESQESLESLESPQQIS